MIQLDFKQRPVDVPSELRLYRRLSMLCISMSECCRGSVASLRQLQFLNSLYLDEGFRVLYLDFKLNRSSLKILSPSADPYLNRCIHYAIGANLISQKEIQNGFRLMLNEEGNLFVKLLKNQKLAQDIFEISLKIGKISETEISSALMMER
jgi:hypothetical protein